MSSSSLPIVLLLALLGRATLSAQAPSTEPASPTTPPKTKPAFVIPPDINGLKTIIPAPAAPRPVKVAIYDGPGAPQDGIENVTRVIKTLPGAEVTAIKAEHMGTVDLKPYDVIVFSGGSGGTQAKGLGEAGKANVRQFVKNGGGYVGVCAGAYLACSNFSWGLGILNASTVSSKWMRGRGFMDVEMTVDGHQLMGEVKDVFKVRYANGPIIKPGDRADLPAYTPIALFRSEIAENGTPKGIMVNSPAQAIGTYGQGRVFISSPHPENTPGLEHMLPRGLLWAAGAKQSAPAVP